ncbi:MAG TPA: hypothetical protein VJ464_17525 [Blastocatellia bacterium]|nr:hypothetical protein [Blastocatellia bacterium]
MTVGRIVTLAMLGAVIAATVCARPAQDQPSASWVLNQVAEAIEKKEQSAQRAGRYSDAQTWHAWATLYRLHADSFILAQTPALQILASYINSNDKHARDMERGRAVQAAKFYRASILFWQDVSEQLGRGEKLKVNLPEQEMLTPVPGLPETPWEFLRVSPAAPSGPAGGQECGQLYKEWRECDQEYERLLKASPTSPSTLMHNFHCINLKYGFMRRCRP